VESKDLQLRDRTALQTISETSLSPAEIIRLDKMLLRTAVYCPNQELSKETLNEFRNAFKDLALLHGADAVESALRELKLTSKFFPHPAEINDVIVAAKELEISKGRWERQREHMRRAQEREREERATTEYVDMNGILKEFYENKGVQAKSPFVAPAPKSSNPLDDVMASLSRGLEAGQPYEPSVVEQILAWREAKRGKSEGNS
jgi:hypothetical protein